ncbi:hypothetical protein Mgra_00002743 [Meloidogyne graminicola]|uniref:Uncharacterized protein n=1 Tax=Meloidogyne graminicola TaxID=189291 RepID=A0A8S9ZX10_9BILA|nr:hypothetical protein Mgra_00002743 [Meloidogyne graminicola]
MSLLLYMFKEDEKENLTFKMAYLPKPLDILPKMPGFKDYKFDKLINEIEPIHEYHKMTLTESHHFITILNEWENNKKKLKVSEIESEYNEENDEFSLYFSEIIKEYKPINKNIFEILNKVNNEKKKNNLFILKETFSNFETNINFRKKK